MGRKARGAEQHQDVPESRAELLGRQSRECPLWGPGGLPGGGDEWADSWKMGGKRVNLSFSIFFFIILPLRNLFRYFFLIAPMMCYYYSCSV